MVHLTVSSYHVNDAFQSESALDSCLNVKEFLARSRRESWRLSDCNGTRTHNHLVHKRTFNHLSQLAKWLSCLVSTYLYGAFDCLFLSCYGRVSEWNHTPQLPECQSEATLHSCLNVKELLVRNRRKIISLSDRNGTRTHKHLVHKRTLSHLFQLEKWLSCVVSTYLYGAFDCLFLSCHGRVWEWIHTP